MGWRLAHVFSSLSFPVLRCRVPSGHHPPGDQPSSLTSVLQGRVGVTGDPGAQKPRGHPPVTPVPTPRPVGEAPTLCERYTHSPLPVGCQVFQ